MRFRSVDVVTAERALTKSLPRGKIRTLTTVTLVCEDEHSQVRGDATPLPGLHSETVEDVLEEILQWRPRILQGITKTEFDLLSLPLRFALETCSLKLNTAAPIALLTARLITGNNQTELQTDAINAIKSGFRVIKFKVDKADWDGRLVNQLWAAVQPASVGFRIDANKCWSFKEALEFASRTASVNVDFIEEPLQDEREIPALVRSRPGVRIALDESIRSVHFCDIIAEPDVRQRLILVVKPKVLGVKRSLELMNTAGLPTVVSSSFETEHGFPALFHLAREQPGVVHGFGTYRWFDDDPEHPWNKPILWPRSSVVLLHGFAGTPDDWAGVTSLLPRCEVLCPALPDCGFEQMCERVAAQIRGFVREGILVGYSLGGRVALAMVARRLVEPRRLLLVSTNMGLKTPEEKANRLAQDRTLAATLASHQNAECFLSDWYGRNRELFGSGFVDLLRKKGVWQSRCENMSVKKTARMLEIASVGATAHMWDDIVRMHGSVQIECLYGQLDKKYASVSAQLTASGVRVWNVPDVFHAVHIEKPISVVNALMEPILHSIKIGGRSRVVWIKPPLSTGGGNAAAYVFVHGCGFAGRMWGDIARRVQEGGAPSAIMCMVDLPMHGENDAAAISWGQLVDDVDDVLGMLTQLGVRRVVLVGHSLGGHIVLRVAAGSALGLVEGVVAIDPVAAEICRTPDFVNQVRGKRSAWTSAEECANHLATTSPYKRWSTGARELFLRFATRSVSNRRELCCKPADECAIYEMYASRSGRLNSLLPYMCRLNDMAIARKVWIVRPINPVECHSPFELSMRAFSNIQEIVLPAKSHFIPMEMEDEIVSLILRVTSLAEATASITVGDGSASMAAR